jgi:ketosteroid isomerase-like protein
MIQQRKAGIDARYACDRALRLVAAVAVMCVIVLSSFGPAAAQKIKESIDRTPQAATPLAVLKSIEKAWNGEDAQAISSFAGDSRVLLEVRGIGHKGGYFSRSQIYYMFKDMFKATTQIKFEFVKFHTPDNPDRRVYGIAHRSYKINRSGRLYQDKVYVTLRKEESSWVVAEIKTTW